MECARARSREPNLTGRGGGGEDSDTTSCRAKEEERASFGEERGAALAGGEDMNLPRRKEKMQEQSC